MKSTGIPQISALLAALALALPACVNSTDTEAASAEPAGNVAAVADQASPEQAKQSRIDHLKKRLEEADSNHDGKLTLSELEASVGAQFAELDADSNGLLSQSELEAMKGKWRGKKGKDGKPGKKGAKHFEKLDADGNGVISREEAPPRMQERFAELDADHDGSLSADELKARRKNVEGKRFDKGHPRMDQDGDGAVSLEEFSKGAKRWFARADANKDNTVTLEELQSTAKAMRGKRGPDGQGKRGEHKGKFLQAADADQDGQITKAEMAAHRAAMFEKIDKNGDGVLTAEDHEGSKGPMGKRGARLDADQDGKVTKAEFLAGSDELFERLDANGDNVISKDELSARRAGPSQGKRGRFGAGPAGR